ncbi:MAG: hydroxyacid dehydrogenase [Anaerolineaceae bacterium]|nr:hydroxyacid dehydrogenase [Anaerolineaceae bacterium]
MGWKVLITDGLEQEGLEIINRKDEAINKKGISAEDLLEQISEYDAMIVRGRTKVTETILEAGKNLKVVGRMGVGVDNIDLQAAKTRKIKVVNSPLATTISVAELTMALMLGLVRNIAFADNGMKAGKWLKKDLVGTELSNKTLGIIGYGNIGEMVSKMAQAFNMTVLSFDPVRSPADVKASGAKPVELEQLIEQSDIITLHIPLIASTKHILNQEAFKKMKDGVKIICAARGGVIDDAALLEALVSGKVSGAALDVFETEPPIDLQLSSHPNVIATPHIGAQTSEAQIRAAIDISSEIIAALDDKPLRWKIV